MIRISNRLLRWEQRCLQKKTENAKKEGRVSASLFLEGEMNAISDADCFFFYGRRWSPKSLLTVFFPDEEHAELTAAEFVQKEGAMTALFRRALEECACVGVTQVHTVRNPACGFDLSKIKGVRFVYDWSEYMLCIPMSVLASEEEAGLLEGTEIKKEEAPERDGTLRYVLLQTGEEVAECRILETDGGKQCYLFGLMTKEAFRRKGMATLLMRKIAKEYASVDGAVLRLQVSSQNVPAERLYRKVGFETEEERQYYKTEELSDGRK